jgi:hypothetical protein
MYSSALAMLDAALLHLYCFAPRFCSFHAVCQSTLPLLIYLDVLVASHAADTATSPYMNSLIGVDSG